MKDNIIYLTKQYEIFKKLEGNRAVLDSRKETIRQSILQHGYIRNPIVVNENMEIIDGQGRFEALKELNMPIEYIMAYGVGQKECIALNANQRNWKSSDYINCFANIGVREFEIIKELQEAYPTIDVTHIISICTNLQNSGGLISRIIKSGSLKLYNEQTIPFRLNLYEQIYEIIRNNSDFGQPRVYAGVVNFLYECDKIDEKRVLENLKKYKEFVYPSFSLPQVLKNLEIVYNRCAKKKTYFMPLYDEWRKNTNN